MKLGRVTGSVVSTKKAASTTGCKLLMVSYLDETLASTGRTEVCVDTTSAGSGDVVLLCSSSSARLTEMTKNVCTDNTIVAIVENISDNSKVVYKSGSSK